MMSFIIGTIKSFNVKLLYTCVYLFRTARDTDYLLISEDIEKYGCGCCSIGVGNFKDLSSQVL